MKRFYCDTTVLSRRAGLSLMEILASVFVLMVGLLGVIAVVPFGILQVAKINKADYGGNCGRAAIQTIRAQKLAVDVSTSFYDPFYAHGNRRQPVGDNGYSNTIGTEAVHPGSPINPIESFVLCERPILVDPLLVCLTLTENNEYDSTAENGLWNFPAGTNTGLPRISCNVPVFAADGGQEERLWSQATFQWQDDRVFAAPVQKADGVENARPIGIASENSADGLQSREDYSWMYMVTPQSSGKQYAVRHGGEGQLNGYYAQGEDGTPVNQLRYYKESEVVGYNVDVIVFYKRELDASEARNVERILPAEMNGTGYRGGPFTLAGTEEELDLTDTNWLLLMWQEEPDNVNVRKTAKWYKIVNYGDIQPNENEDEDSDVPFVRRVMLLGPDVPTTVVGGAGGYRALLTRGAIHVFSTVMPKEEL